MESIIPITGNVNFKITLDPSVWIFDDRKVDLNTYFSDYNSNSQDQENKNQYMKASKLWDREINGETYSPPILKSTKKFEKEKIITGTFGIPIRPFIINAEPEPQAEFLVLETSDGNSYKILLTTALEGILGFSSNGKPLKEDGPVYFYYGDGSNQDTPIKKINKLTVV